MEDKKSKRSKKNESGSSENVVIETKTNKSPKKKTNEVQVIVVTKVSIEESIPIEHVIDKTPEKVVIPSKTVVFRRIKMKSKHKRRTPTLNVISEWEKKNTCKLIITIESIEDEDERIPETSEANLHKESLIPE
ncbi:unnamed protein product [Lactuca saligna]|uniref:Uncharacterized protein n=1 Tax=Lactuca saligna TaxID=75948 RepID=A0AA35ZG25_LACSI|nr:unnamed protein product [Lactuca saligna]